MFWFIQLKLVKALDIIEEKLMPRILWKRDARAARDCTETAREPIRELQSK